MNSTTCNNCLDEAVYLTEKDEVPLCRDCYEEEHEDEADVDDDGFVKCGHCGAGGGSHATEDCPTSVDDYEDEECPGNEEDYEWEECCDSGCKSSGHWYKKEQ